MAFAVEVDNWRGTKWRSPLYVYGRIWGERETKSKKSADFSWRCGDFV